MKIGCVAITGKPNVGKSTFLNALLQKKVAIVSPKPQTTRNQIRGVYQDKDLKIEFIDTPGYHKPNFKLDLFLNSQIKASYKQADVVLFFVDLTRPIDEEDYKIKAMLKDYKVAHIIVVFTKFDLSSDKKTQEYLLEIQKEFDISDVIAISSKKQINFDQLLKKIDALLPNEPRDIQILENDNLFISEIIREQIIFNTKQELPYASGVFVELNHYDNFTRVLTIEAVIVVEKDSQKPIIIGRRGAMIKKIGTMARKELLNIYDCKINLKLFVKVQNDWRNNEKFLSQIGYSNKK